MRLRGRGALRSTFDIIIVCIAYIVESISDEEVSENDIIHYSGELEYDEESICTMENDSMSLLFMVIICISSFLVYPSGYYKQ